MAILRNLASMSSATAGTGTLTLGTATSGYITFDQTGVPHGGVSVTYLIIDGSNREAGRGVYTFSTLALTRVTVLASTNAGAKITCTGTQTVLIVDAAEDHIWIDEAQVPAFTAAQKSQLFSNIGGAPYGGLLIPPVLANFTQFGTGGTFTQNSNANSVSVSATTSTGTSLKGGKITAPATPYRAQALIKPQLLTGPNAGARNFVGFTDGTKFTTICLDTNGSVEFDILEWSDTTTFAQAIPSSNTHTAIPDTVWLAVADDGTTVYYEYSYDGVNWVSIRSNTRSAGYLGSSGYTNVCFGMDSFHNAAASFTVGTVLLSWNTVASAP